MDGPGLGRLRDRSQPFSPQFRNPPLNRRPFYASYRQVVRQPKERTQSCALREYFKLFLQPPPAFAISFKVSIIPKDPAATPSQQINQCLAHVSVPLMQSSRSTYPEGAQNTAPGGGMSSPAVIPFPQFR